MANSFAIIYFIHDDLGGQFNLNIVPTLLERPFNKDVRIILIHNRRTEHDRNDGGGRYVTYHCVVREVVDGGRTRATFNTIFEKICSWQTAVIAAFEHLGAHNCLDRVGLITLSHSNGFVINRNREILPIRICRSIFFFFRRLFQKKLQNDFRYIRSKQGDKSVYVAAQTVVVEDVGSQTESSTPGKVVLTSRYSRAEDDFCRTYEGLFVYELASFLKAEVIDKILHGRKLVFYISSNCNFQLYDNLYLFEPVAEYVMGAQSTSASSFWYFPRISLAVENNLVATHYEICRAIFNGCRQKFWSDNVQEIIKHYFLVETSEIRRNLHIQFESIIRKLIANCNENPSFVPDFLKAVGNMEWTSRDFDYPYFDILELFTAANKVSNPPFDTELKAFKCAWGQVIVDSFCLDRQLSGFSLYFPRSREEFLQMTSARCSYFENNRRNEFVKNSSYEDFLTVFFQ